MASDKAVKLHYRISNLLHERKLHESFSLLSSEIATQSDPTLLDLLKKQEDTYRYMLHYLVEGYADDGREKMLSKIVSTLLFVNDSVLRNKTIIDSPDIYSSTLRFERIRKVSLESRLSDYRKAESMAMLAMEAGGDNQMRKDADDKLLALFSYIWTMFGSCPDDYKALSNAVSDPDMTFQFKSQVISALMLGCMRFFDREAVECLLDIYDSDPGPRLSARVLVALVFIIESHPKRVETDDALMARLSLWEDSIIIYRQLREVVMSVIRSHDTERISNKMQNEVFPELMKLRPEILKKLKNVSENSDLEMLDINPEWEELLNKNGLGDKLKELTEMQMEGGDIMMMAFSNLKSFPFFNSVANWFLPFFSGHHEIASPSLESAGMLNDVLDMEGVMCDSDKFSFAFSLLHMPESQRTMMTERMGAQMAQLKEAMADKKLKSSVPEFDSEVTRYVRDIYRFFKLFRKKNDFTDPFAKPLDFNSLPVISDILSDNEILNLVGEFYFKRGYYAEALPLLEKLDKENREDSLLWEKIGYCHNALGNLEDAMKWYKRAELVHPDSKWLLKKMALCSRMLNRFEEAAEYYAKALESDPDNYHLLMSSGHCMLESGDIMGAVANYYHADYVKPGKPSTWRAIAWGELLNENASKSLEYYSKILKRDDSTAIDHLNSGHANYILGNLKEAAECYKRSSRHPGFGMEGLEKAIADDMDALMKLGVNPLDLNLLIEKVKYDL